MNDNIVVKLFTENATNYGLVNIDVWDLSLLEIRGYLKTFIADLFVDMVFKYKNGSRGDKTQPTIEELQIIFELVSAAGFKVSNVNIGNLIGNYVLQDGEKTGDTYPVNKSCPFKVIDLNSEDYYFATGWLDCAWRLVSGIKQERGSDIENIKREIERSIPFDPIILNEYGERLIESSPRIIGFSLYEYFVDHTKDDRAMGFLSVGLHDYCGGAIENIRVSEKFSALVCRKCCLHIPFPVEIKTCGELRRHMESQLKLLR